jgi:rhodanese-related sulfurtransferase
MNHITPQQLHELRERGETIHLIDVRTPGEFGEVHASYAHNLPSDTLDAAEVLKHCGGVLEHPVYFICHGGGRSSRVCDAMAKAGLTGVVNLAGGTKAWEEAGLPVVRGKKATVAEKQAL